MWSSLFIIDPVFTLPLAAACLLAAWLGERAGGQRALLAGLLLSSAYLLWSQVAKREVELVAQSSLTEIGLAQAPRFSVPMPFNTLLWRVVVMTPDGFLEGERSLVADRGPMRFRKYASDAEELSAVSALPAVRELRWFTHGFLKANRMRDELVVSDLRMGAEPDYSFRFVVARAGPEGWDAIPPRQLRWPWGASRRLPAVWQRIWETPPGEETR